MAFDFTLPDVGEGIDAAEIVEWHVAPGDPVTEDQLLVDVHTDKAIVAIPCPTTGTVVSLGAAPGATLPVGALLAVFEPNGGVATPGAGPALARTEVSTTQKPLASPAVRRLATQRGIHLDRIRGSGPHGRITREDLDDVDRAPTTGDRAERDRPAAQAGADEVVPLRGTRRAIAHTLTRAWQTIPHVTDYRQVDATGLIAAREALKARATAAGDEQLARALTPTALLIKMAALALRRHPYVNAAVDLERAEITLRARVNVGIATATADGLLVPVVHDADRRTVHDLAREAARLAEAARERSLTPADFAEGTFTLNNYGPLGIWLGTPIIQPGQAANLGVGKIEDRAVARGGEVVIRPVLAIACSGDHRLLDGHTLAAFVDDVVALIEDPSLMLGELA